MIIPDTIISAIEKIVSAAGWNFDYCVSANKDNTMVNITISKSNGSENA